MLAVPADDQPVSTAVALMPRCFAVPDLDNNVQLHAPVRRPLSDLSPEAETGCLHQYLLGSVQLGAPSPSVGDA